ncbi:MAG: HAD hydrolase-like protein [Bacteroidota bacterium]
MNQLAVIFDMDGVIVDNADFHYPAWKQTCDQYGIFLSE